MQRLTIPKRAASDPKIFTVAAHRDGIWGVGLKLDSIRPHLLCRVDESDCLLEILMVISGKLRDDIDLMSNADFVPRNRESRRMPVLMACGIFPIARHRAAVL